MASNRASVPSSTHSLPIPECCMCGDCGLSSELFQCKVCQFRSQHRYCSNLYPNEESYQVCNWCLSFDTKEKSQNSSNSSSSNKNNSDHDCRKVNFKQNTNSCDINRGGLYSQRSALSSQINGPIKKPRSPERSASTRRRLITNGKLEEKLGRTRSADISKTNGKLEEKLGRTRSIDISKTNGIIKQVYRNKVRRYKLLDEVSS